MANGKGDLRRPSVIPEHELSARWFQTFGNTRCPLNPAVARSEIAAASGPSDAAHPYKVEHIEIGGQPATLLTAEDALPGTLTFVQDGKIAGQIVNIGPTAWVGTDGNCLACGEGAKLSTRCHGGLNTKKPGPRRK